MEMIRTRLSLIIIPLLIGLVVGYYIESMFDPSAEYDKVYETVSNGYLADNVDVLELIVMLQDLSVEYPDVSQQIFSILQKNEIVLKVLDGGKFKVVKSLKSNLSPKHLFVKLKSIDSGTTFWVCSTSIKRVKKGDVK